MYQSQQLVGIMMTSFGQEVRTFPNMIQDSKERLLTANLVIEEAFEFVEEMGFTISVDAQGKPVLAPGAVPHLANAGKELADIQVVIDGAANRLGLDLQKLFVEVNASNMSKTVNGKVIRRESDGKVLKPDSYKPADIARIIDETRKSRIEATINVNYHDLQIPVAQGVDLLTAITLQLAPEFSLGQLNTSVDNNYTDSAAYKTRSAVKTLVYLGVNNQVHVDQIAASTGLSVDAVTKLAMAGVSKYPLLFSSQVVLPEEPKPAPAPAPASTPAPTPQKAADPVKPADPAKPKGKAKPADAAQSTEQSTPPVTTAPEGTEPAATESTTKPEPTTEPAAPTGDTK